MDLSHISGFYCSAMGVGGGGSGPEPHHLLSRGFGFHKSIVFLGNFNKTLSMNG